MSAENLYQPHVHLDGELLGEGRGHNGPAAIARISIKWGAGDWYSDVDAAVLKITVLDPSPDYGLVLAKRRAPIILTRDPDYSTVFRGSVTEATTRPTVFMSPLAGQPQRTYAHELVCADPLASLQRDRRRGPVYTAREGEDLVAHWGPCTMAERKRDLQSRTTVPLEFTTSPIDQYDDLSTAGFVYTWPVVPYETQQVVSALTVLRNTVRIGRPLARPYYHPGNGAIVPVEPPYNKSGFGLVRSSSDYRLSTTDTQLLDGSVFRLNDEVAVSSSMLEQVTRVELKLRAARPNQLVTSANSSDGSRQRLEWVEQPQTFDLMSNAEAQMTVSVDSDHSWAYFDTRVNHQIRLGMQLGMSFGLPRLPDLAYRFSKHEAAPGWALPWLTPAPPLDAAGVPTVYQPLNSIANAHSELGPFAIPGGTLTYTQKQGWEATLHAVPVGYTPSALTLADLNSGPTGPRLDHSADSATVSDLQHVSTVLDY